MRPAAAVLTLSLLGVSAPAQPSGPMPQRLSDSAFWSFIRVASEPTGYFQQDNWTSNEMDFPVSIAHLMTMKATGGAFIGVGPEQNFSYVAAIRPSVAFIVDIRRLAVMQHLMYKAIFELSADRADFASLLFARPRPAGLDSSSTVDEIWAKYYVIQSQYPALAAANITRIIDHLTRKHRFDLDAADREAIRRCYQQFASRGPRIGYASNPQFARNYQSSIGPNGIRARVVARYEFVNFASLTASVDNDGVARSFMASEEAYRSVRDLQLRNMFIPVVGDFAGPRALRAVGQFVRDHGETVTAFYLSNVEDYLFRDPTAPSRSIDKWKAFYANAATLPVTPRSTFIRYVVANGEASLCPMADFLAAFAAGRILYVSDAMRCAK